MSLVVRLLAWLNDVARRAERAQVCEVWLGAVDHLIWRTSFHSIYQRPVPNILMTTHKLKDERTNLAPQIPPHTA